MEEKKVKLVAAVCTQCGAQLEVDPNSASSPLWSSSFGSYCATSCKKKKIGNPGFSYASLFS